MGPGQRVDLSHMGRQQDTAIIGQRSTRDLQAGMNLWEKAKSKCNMHMHSIVYNTLVVGGMGKKKTCHIWEARQRADGMNKGHDERASLLRSLLASDAVSGFFFFFLERAA